MAMGLVCVVVTLSHNMFEFERVEGDFVLWSDYSDFGRMLVDFVTFEVILVNMMSLSHRLCGHVWALSVSLMAPKSSVYLTHQIIV